METREGKRKALGKGLEQLFTNERINFEKFEDEIIKNAKESDIGEISLIEIRTNPYQPRKVFDEKSLNELAASILEHGVVVPIIVKKSIKGYELIAGERRTKAAKIAGLKTIPAIVREFTDNEMMEIALVENIQRENLNALEEATAYDSILKATGMTQETLAKKFGKSRTHVTNMVGLLRLPSEVQKLVTENKLSMAHARCLSKLDDIDYINHLSKRIIDESMSVRELENILSRRIENIDIPKRKGKNANPKFAIYENILREKIGTKVKINNFKVEIPFDSEKDLERILEIINIKVEGE